MELPLGKRRFARSVRGNAASSSPFCRVLSFPPPPPHALKKCSEGGWRLLPCKNFLYAFLLLPDREGHWEGNGIQLDACPIFATGKRGYCTCKDWEGELWGVAEIIWRLRRETQRQARMSDNLFALDTRLGWVFWPGKGDSCALSKLPVLKKHRTYWKDFCICIKFQFIPHMKALNGNVQWTATEYYVHFPNLCVKSYRGWCSQVLI